MTQPVVVHRERDQEDDNCPGRGKLLRECTACGAAINKVSDPYVIVSPSWKRCNDILCRPCFALTMRSAAVVIRASQRGAVLYVQEPMGELGIVVVDTGGE